MASRRSSTSPTSSTAGRRREPPWRGDRGPGIAVDPALTPGMAVERRAGRRPWPRSSPGSGRERRARPGSRAGRGVPGESSPPGPGSEPLEIAAYSAAVGALRVLRRVPRPERVEEAFERGRRPSRRAGGSCPGRPSRRGLAGAASSRRGPRLAVRPAARRPGPLEGGRIGAPPASRSPTGSLPSGITIGAPHLRQSQASPRCATGPSSASWMAPTGTSFVV